MFRPVMWYSQYKKDLQDGGDKSLITRVHVLCSWGLECNVFQAILTLK